jgi:hypothetical protein
MNSSSAELKLSRALSNQTTIVERNNNNKKVYRLLGARE